VFKNRDMAESETALRRHFTTLRNAHAHGVLPDEELSHYLSEWGRSVSNLSTLSPSVAFICACTAWNICKAGESQLPCDKLIVNTVAICINGFAYRALNEYADSKKMMDMNDTKPYIFALGNVLMTLAPHVQSSHLQETYYETLTKFEEILFSAYVPPTERYKHVIKIRNFAEARGPATHKLLSDMDSLLAQFAGVLLNGQGIILNPLEIQADELAVEHYLATVNDAILEEMEKDRQREKQRKSGLNIIPFSKALALRSGVPAGCADLHQTIERSFQVRDYQAAEDSLFDLFNRLAEMPENISPYHYLLVAADRLSTQSLTHGFHLASRCVEAIEESAICSEALQETVCGFAVPAIVNWEGLNNSRLNETKELNKVIMKRSSEFLDSEQAGDIFESSAIGFREYLGSITPQQRYDELIELSVWLGGRKYPSPMMGTFVDDLMNSARDYGSFKGIPLEEDTICHLALIPAP
jgi:hypothetical protein